MTSLSFFVPGAVSGQGSKRPVRRGSKTVLLDMNAQLQPWRDSICYAARLAAQEAFNWRDQHGPVFTGPVLLHLEATYARPKSHYRTGKNAHLLREDAPYYKSSAPDSDKACRAAADAITQSGVWKDDALVADLRFVKRYFQQGTPGLNVVIGDLA